MPAHPWNNTEFINAERGTLWAEEEEEEEDNPHTAAVPSARATYAAVTHTQVRPLQISTVIKLDVLYISGNANQNEKWVWKYRWTHTTR